MKMQLKRKDHGFTIIEVLIVLAIAGLILAIVFFAVPQLQRNQRDNQRQSIATRSKAELETYAANSQGKYPFVANGICNGVGQMGSANGNCREWFDTYMGSGKVNISDPSTGSDTVYNAVYVLASSPTQPTWAQGSAYLEIGGKCSGSSAAPVASGTAAGTSTSKQYAVVESLDRNGTFFCVDNG